MTDLLKDTLDHQVSTLDPPRVDVDRLIRDGNRRVARRRTAWAGGGVAAATVLALAIPQLPIGGGGGNSGTARDEANSQFAAAFTEHTPTYTVGTTVHIGARTFEISQPARAFVQTSIGIVYADADGVVRATDGGSETEIGTLSFHFADRALASDGPMAAWIEAGDTPQLAVLDQSSGEVSRTSLQAGAVTTEFDVPAEVAAIDGDTVYLQDARGLLSWRDGELEVLMAGNAGRRLELDDVKNGVFAWRATNSDSYRVGRDLSSGVQVEAFGGGTLSPDGSALALEVDYGQNPAVIDTATGDPIPAPARTQDGWHLGYAWPDSDTYVAVAIRGIDGSEPEPAGGWRFEQLTCSVTAVSCQSVETELRPGSDGSTIPIGRDWNPS